MNTTYKSERSEKVATAAYTGQSVPESVEKEILDGVPYTPEVALDNKINEYEMIKKDIKRLGIQTPLQRVVYAVTDMAGITSPRRRINKIERRLESTVSDLSSRLAGVNNQIEQASEKHRQATEMMFNAGTIMHKYKAIENGLAGEIETYRAEHASLNEKLANTDSKDPGYGTLQENLSDREREKAKIEADLDGVAYKKDSASTAVKMSSVTRNVYRSNLNSFKQARKLLQSAKGKADFKLNLFRQYIKQNPDNILGVLEAVKHWQEQSRMFEDEVGDVPDRMRKAVLNNGDVSFGSQDADYKAMVESDKEMQRNQTRTESESVREAEEILRNAWT